MFNSGAELDLHLSVRQKPIVSTQTLFSCLKSTTYQEPNKLHKPNINTLSENPSFTTILFSHLCLQIATNKQKNQNFSNKKPTPTPTSHLHPTHPPRIQVTVAILLLLWGVFFC